MLAVHSGMTVVVEVVVPVEVGQIDILLTAVAPVGDDPPDALFSVFVVVPAPERALGEVGLPVVGGGVFCVAIIKKSAILAD